MSSQTRFASFFYSSVFRRWSLPLTLFLSPPLPLSLSFPSQAHKDEDKAKVSGFAKKLFKGRRHKHKDAGGGGSERTGGGGGSLGANGSGGGGSGDADDRGAGTDVDINGGLDASEANSLRARVRADGQKPGIARQLTSAFLTLRGKTTSRIELETNKLLNRLEKLTNALKTEVRV